MSPEQALGKPVDVRSDVFSFGVVLYEMLSGTRPFAGRRRGELLVAIVRDAAPPLRERAPEVDEATEAIVTRCLAKAPAERFANAGEIVAALSAAVAGDAGRPSDPEAAEVDVGAWLGVAVACRCGRSDGDHRDEAPDGARGICLRRPAGHDDDRPASPSDAGRRGGPASMRRRCRHGAMLRSSWATSTSSARYSSTRTSPWLTSWLRCGARDPSMSSASTWPPRWSSGSQLGERDAAILEAERIRLSTDKPDIKDEARRWKALADRYPLDAFVAAGAAFSCLGAGHKDEGFALWTALSSSTRPSRCRWWSVPRSRRSTAT